VYALRPAAPLQVVAGSCFYAPRDSFVYPGGVEEMGPADGRGRTIASDAVPSIVAEPVAV
jgi:hypothetical protein